MTQEIPIGSVIVVLDSESNYSGYANPTEEEKLVRKAIGLPIKKQLIYYKNKHQPESIVNIKSYRLIEMYNITERWYTIEITTEEGKSVRIHSGYLIEMQKPSFIEDMEEQIEKQ